MTTTNPTYLRKPSRRIAGTDFYAVTLHRSGDGTLREYAILSADGAVLGHVSTHGSRIGRPAGLHEGRGCYDHRLRTWQNLAQAAATFAAEQVTR